MPNDQDKPQVTQSSNSNELQKSDPIWTKPALLRPPELADQHLGSRSRNSQDDLRTDLIQAYEQRKRPAELRDTPNPSAQDDPMPALAGPSPELAKAMRSYERGVIRNRKGPQLAEKQAMQDSQSANPMHPRDRRLLANIGIWAALFVAVVGGGIGAFVGDSPHWGFGLCAGGLLAAYVIWLRLSEAKPTVPTAKFVWAVLIGIAVPSWCFAISQIWLAFHKPGQGYTQAELDKAVSQAATSLQSKLDEVTKEKDVALSDGQILRRGEQGQISLWSNGPQSYPQAFGTTCSLNLTSVATAFWSRAPRGTAILITAAQGNEQLQRNLLGTFEIGTRAVSNLRPDGGKIFIEGPNYSVDIDAPRLPAFDQNGLIVHGDDPQDTLKINWGNYFVVRRTSKVPDGLAEYYKVPSIVWIEIGPGNPWARPTSCSAG